MGHQQDMAYQVETGVSPVSRLGDICMLYYVQYPWYMNSWVLYTGIYKCIVSFFHLQLYYFTSTVEEIVFVVYFLATLSLLFLVNSKFVNIFLMFLEFKVFVTLIVFS